MDAAPVAGAVGKKSLKRKLTQTMVDEIRAKYLTGQFSQAELGAEYGVSGTHVSHLVHGQAWPSDSFGGLTPPPDMEGEVWRSISRFPAYAVSNCGRVRRDLARSGARKGRILKPVSRGRQGVVVILYAPDFRRCLEWLHVLVAESFVPPFAGSRGVMHLNENRGDNRAENLKWFGE